LQLGLLLLEGGDLRLELNVLHLLSSEVSLELVFDSLCFDLKGLSDFNALVAENIFELLLLMAEHLYFTLVELNVFIDSSDHFF